MNPGGRPTVAVVGLGQIGGSLAAALTRRRMARVVGVTRREETVRRAVRMGIVSAAGTDLEAVSRADVTVLATPVRNILRQIPEAARLAPPGAVLTDVGSTKAEIMEAFRLSAPRAAVVAGHPMAGNEKAGLDGCDPDLFENRPWVLIPGPGAGRRARRLLEGLVTGVGARPIWMADPAEHDLAAARVSHVPYLLAYALMELPWRDLRMAGNSFRDATRVALSDPVMVLDFLLTNRGPLRRAARELAARLAALSALAWRGGEKGLLKRLKRALLRRRRL